MTDPQAARKLGEDAAGVYESCDPVYVRRLARALLAALGRTEAAEKALLRVRGVFPQDVCSECAGFEHEVTEANAIIDEALAAAAGGEPIWDARNAEESG